MTDLWDINEGVMSSSLIESHSENHLLPQVNVMVTGLTREVNVPEETESVILRALVSSENRVSYRTLNLCRKWEPGITQFLTFSWPVFEPVATSWGLQSARELLHGRECLPPPAQRRRGKGWTFIEHQLCACNRKTYLYPFSQSHNLRTAEWGIEHLPPHRWKT